MQMRRKYVYSCNWYNTNMKTTDPQALHILGSDVRYWVFHPDKPKTIVMIHGFRGTNHGLHDIIRALPNYRIVIPDLPGFGESTPMAKTPHDISGYTEFVRQFIDELKLTEKPALLGHSFGSIITASFAAAHGDMIEKLILINAIATPALKGPRAISSFGAKLYYRIGAKLPERAGRALLSSKTMVKATSVVLTKTKDKALKKDIHRHHLRHFSSFHNRDTLLEAFNASINHNVSEYAEYIHVPTLLIAGALDDIAPVEGQIQLTKKLPDSRLVIVEHVGHLIHREAPSDAAEAISEFLN